VGTPGVGRAVYGRPAHAAGSGASHPRPASLRARQPGRPGRNASHGAPSTPAVTGSRRKARNSCSSSCCHSSASPTSTTRYVVRFSQ